MVESEGMDRWGVMEGGGGVMEGVRREGESDGGSDGGGKEGGGVMEGGRREGE